MSGLTSDNRRQKVRVCFDTDVVIKTEDSEYNVKGSSKDLSINGILILMDEDLVEGTKCDIEVLLSGVTKRIALEMKGSVVRSDESGIAITFHSMDLDSYSHLKNIVRYNTEDCDSVY
ncbi:MAG: PilZ domain-containing protein [Desulfobacterales bacterium]|nr:PilZ domain-containing protein [Desulfobacterales bacterium]